MPVTVISNYNQVKDREKAESMNALPFWLRHWLIPDDILAQVEKRWWREVEIYLNRDAESCT